MIAKTWKLHQLRMASLGMSAAEITQQRRMARVSVPGHTLVGRLMGPDRTTLVVEFYDYKGTPLVAHYSWPCEGYGFVSNDQSTIASFCSTMLNDLRNCYGEIQRPLDYIPYHQFIYNGTPVIITDNGDVTITMYSGGDTQTPQLLDLTQASGL